MVADSKISRSICCHSGTVSFLTITLYVLFHLFCFCLFNGINTQTQSTVVIGPTSSGPNPKINLKPKSFPKNPKVKLGLKNLEMLLSYFNYIFVQLRQKVRLRPELNPIFCQAWARTRPEPDLKSPARLTTLNKLVTCRRHQLWVQKRACRGLSVGNDRF